MLETIKNALWSPVLVLALAYIGVSIMVKLKFSPVLQLPRILKETVFSAHRDRKAFSLMCTSLGGTIGVGNAIGVAGAVLDGGAGAVFWMGIACLLGMGIKYAEVYFSVYYASDRQCGPIAYIKESSQSDFVPLLYAFLCLTVSFGMGNLSQVKAAVLSFDGLLDLPQYILSLIISLLFIVIAVGGINKIRAFSEVVIPLFTLFYLVLLTAVILKQRERIPFALKEIMRGSGIMCGFKWALIKSGITSGFSKAIFSSEAGLGSAGFAHTAGENAPYQQARWAIAEVLADSVICILTAIALITLSPQLCGVPESMMTKAAFVLSFGNAGDLFYAVSMNIFAFSSLLCWYYNGSCAVEYITKKKRFRIIYCLIFTFVAFSAGFVDSGAIIDISDIANALMLVVNICALGVLVKKIH